MLGFPSMISNSSDAQAVVFGASADSGYRTRLSNQFQDMEVTGMDYPRDATFRDCIFPWEYPYITWDGYYVPCCGKPFPKLLNFGNVFEQGVMPVLNSPKAQAFRRAWQQNTPPAFCHNCQLTDN